MEIQRTANAGVLLKLDGVGILLDGVCQEADCYLATPPEIQQELLENVPDGVLFTHTHPDHYSPAYAQSCGREVVLPDGTEQNISVGPVQITAIPTRHMGKAEGLHQSFVLQGSRCIWFLGDAAPTELKKFAPFPKPEVLLVPYPYVSSKHVLAWLEQLLPCEMILLHLPDPAKDEAGLWEMVRPGIESLKSHLHIPQIGQAVEL